MSPEGMMCLLSVVAILGLMAFIHKLKKGSGY